MPSPESLRAALEEQLIRRAVERRILPYGGCKATARVIYDLHGPARWPWMDRCAAGCREAYPCRDRRGSSRVLNGDTDA